MYKLCKTEQSANRQRVLEEGLLNTMRHKRYEEITISELCDQMGIPRKSFYRYFSSKDGALHALIDHRLLEFQQETGLFTSGMADVDRQCLAFFNFWYNEKVFLDALEKSDLSGILVQRAIRQAQEEYNFPYEMIPTELYPIKDHAICFAICGIMSMVTRWHRGGYQESVEEMAVIAAAILTQPLMRNVQNT